MEATNPRASIPEAWAPPPPVAATPAPQQEALSGEEAFDAVIGNLVEQFNSLPPPAYGEPIAELDQPVDAPMAALPERYPIRPAPSARRQTRSRWTLPLAAGISMLFGGGLTLMLMVGPQELWQRISGEGGEAAVPATPKVVVSFGDGATTPKVIPEPKAEPLAEPLRPVATPIAVEPLKPVATPIAAEPLKPVATPIAADPAPAVVEASAKIDPPVVDAKKRATKKQPASKKRPKRSQAARRREKRKKAANAALPAKKAASSKAARPARAKKTKSSDWEDPYK